MKVNTFYQNIKLKGPIVYVDMDGVICNFSKKFNELKMTMSEHAAMASEGLFENLEPISGAIEAVYAISELYEVYFLTTAPWSNVYSWTEKRIWIGKNFDKRFNRKLIISSNKGLLSGEYLIDDNLSNGVGDFKGKHIHFGTEKFPDWDTIVTFLLNNDKKII